MKKTIKDFEKEQQICIDIVKKKNADYSHSHFLQNFDNFGYKGIMVRLGDKFDRIKTFYFKDKFEVKDETLVDTLRDLANYAIFCILKYEEEKDDKDSNINRK